MDIYAEVQSPDPAELINSPFGGRYCGPIPPRRRVSLYRAIALSFYTAKNQTTPDVFDGRYQFINECKILPFWRILSEFFENFHFFQLNIFKNQKVPKNSDKIYPTKY